MASVLIIGHLWAVIGRPLEFATQGPFGASPSMTRFRDPVRGYSQFAYLDHGYAFFAPEPGPSHLIRATITPPSGTDATTTGTDAAASSPSPVAPLVRNYPDLNDQWPRLLYHRHFMLAEFLNDIYHPPGEPPQEIARNPVAIREWIQARRRYETVRDSILNRLQTAYPQATVAIDRLEHRQPGLPEFMEDNVPLDAPQLYFVLPDALPPLPLEPLPPAPIAESPAAESPAAESLNSETARELEPATPGRSEAARGARPLVRPIIPRLPLRAPIEVTP